MNIKDDIMKYVEFIKKTLTRWGRGGYIETVWAERGAGRSYNTLMSNLSKTLNNSGEMWVYLDIEFIKNLEKDGGEVGTSRQYWLKGGRA